MHWKVLLFNVFYKTNNTITCINVYMYIYVYVSYMQKVDFTNKAMLKQWKWFSNNSKTVQILWALIFIVL